MTGPRWMHWCTALAILVSSQDGAQKTEAATPELSIEVVLRGKAAQGNIEFGVPFALEVFRRWPVDAAVEPWRDAALAPLIVMQESISRVVDDGGIVETRRFKAWAFRRGGLTLQPEFGLAVPKDKAGKEPELKRVTAKLCTLLVDSALPEDDEGAAEPPPAPTLQITPVRRELLDVLALASGAGALAWLLIAGFRWGRRRRTTPVGPRAELLARVEDLARARADTRDAQRTEAVAATRILRAAEQLAAERDPTETERGATSRESVHETLATVKFAGVTLSSADRQAWIADLQRIVMSVPTSASADSDAGVATTAAANAEAGPT